MPNGKKLWRLKYYYLGKEKRLSLGSYPTITLRNAREKRERARKLLDEGVDPSKDRKEQQRQAILASNNSFEVVAMEWYEKQLDKWSEKRKKTVLERLKKNIFPHLGNTPIAEIRPLELLDVLRIIEDRGALDVAKRVNRLCARIFNYGIITARCETNPASHLSDALKKRTPGNYPALSPNEIPEFLDAFYKNNVGLLPVTQNAILFSMLTFVRPKEVRHARWSDINIDEREWHIPAKFMKKRREHIVPLARQTLEVLNNQRQLTRRLNTDWVFPNQKSILRPMSDGTVNKAVGLLGFKGRHCAHGFRALACTSIREKLKYPIDIINIQLAHKPKDATRGAYDRAQFLEERKIMMQDWADYVL